MSFLPMWPTLVVAVLAWLHVFAAVGRMGAVMTLVLAMGPGLGTMSQTARLEFFATLVPRYGRYVAAFSGLTIVFGALLAVSEYQALFSPMTIEGTYIMVGAVLALVAFLFVMFLVVPMARKVGVASERALKDGNAPPELPSMQRRFRSLGAFGLTLLILILVLMIAAAWT